jgi:hypothetical protein
MSIKSVYAFKCQNPKCPLYIALPRQSHLGKFDDQLSPATEIWPIQYLCLDCGHLSGVPSESIRLEAVETQDQYQLVRYDFASDQSGFLHHCAICTQEDEFGIAYRALRHQDGQEAIERVLKASKIWDGSYEYRINVSPDRGAQHIVPKEHR